MLKEGEAQKSKKIVICADGGGRGNHCHFLKIFKETL